MSVESSDAIDAAIQSAESLFASLLDRAPPGRLSREPTPDPEASLSPGATAVLPESSIISLGAASLGPAQLTAVTNAVYEDLDPRESLSAIGVCVCVCV